MRRTVAALVLFLVASVSVAGKGARDPGLKIYFIDVEGGAATLVVTPAGESILLDSGDAGGRDARRIAKVAREHAGLQQIDHYVITHWHDDHYGGTQELSELLPVARYYDHGPSIELQDFDQKFGWYLRLSKKKRSILKPGDLLPLKSIAGGQTPEILCLTSAGKTLSGKPAASASCANHDPKPADASDNSQSISVLLSLGAFRFLDCGDLTWNVEHELVCPENRVGLVDLFQVTHHGLALSNNPALVHAIRPSVAVINNGARKGAEAEVLGTLRKSPGLEAIFQLHLRSEVDAALQAPPARIANDEEPCQGKNILVDVDPSGSRYTIHVDGRDQTSSFDTRRR
jgi:beta-lactamase superfamily II metal-dependent hydrolase